MLTGLIALISLGCIAQTYYCPLSSVDGISKKIEQRFIIQEGAVSIAISSNGNTDSLHYKKIASTNPTVIYFQKDGVTSGLTIIHSPGTMKGIKYTDVLSFKKDLQAKESVGLWYCTLQQNNP